MFRFTLASAFIVFTSSVFAQYKFEGTHSYKLERNAKKQLFASLCYDGFRRCHTVALMSSEEELKTYLQLKIFSRKDQITLANVDRTLAESQKVLNAHQIELQKRQKQISDLRRRDPKAADLMQPLVDEINNKIFFDNSAITRLIDGKKNSLDLMDELEQTLSGLEPRSYKVSYYDDFENFMWNRCHTIARDSRKLDCLHAGIQFFMKERGVQNLLLTHATRTQNTKAGYPKQISDKLQLALLTTDFATFGKTADAQMATPTGMQEVDESCKATTDTGNLLLTQVSCKVFGQNWRYPTAKEMKANRSLFLENLPALDKVKLFLTGSVKHYTAQNAAHLGECFPVYYNLAYGGSVNDDNRLVRTFTFGDTPKGGAGALCVCSENCDVK